MKTSLKELISRTTYKRLAGTFSIFTAVVETVTQHNLGIMGIPQKYSQNFVGYFPRSKNGMTKSVGTQKKLFHIIVVHSKQPIEKNGTCY